MGIRALGFLKPEDYKEGPEKFLAAFRENLFKLGAFGFETWEAKIFSHKKDKNSDSAIRLLYFNDTPDQNILITHTKEILVGDSHFPSLLKNIGFAFDKKPCVFKVNGLMAQLGDFKVRYGIAQAKIQNAEKTVGILFDIEYLPVSKLSVDFNLIFSSVCEMMNLSNISLITPQPENSEDQQQEYSFMILGHDYMQLLSNNEIAV